MPNIQFAIEGSGAVEATEELLAMSEISGSWQPAGENSKELTLATIATIVAITGGVVGTVAGAASTIKTTMDIAEKIYDWYQDWSKGKQSKTIDKVVLVTSDGERLLLQNAKPEDIADILEKL